VHCLHTCATPEADKLPVPLLSFFRSKRSSSFRESYSHCTRSLSNFHEKSSSPPIVQMSPWHQWITGHANLFSNNNNSFNSIVNFITGIDEEERRILKWLSPLEPQKRHQSVRTGRLEGVGNWVLETSKFRKWRDAEDRCVEPVLFCYGNPGAGKTYVR